MDNFARVLSSSPATWNRLLDIVKDAFRFGRVASEFVIAGIKELNSKSAKARNEYHTCLSNLREVRRKVEAYIELVETHPICSEEMREQTLAELHDQDKDARLEIQNKDKFPRTGQFVKELTDWLGKVVDKYQNVSKCFAKFNKKTKDLLLEAQDVVDASRMGKKVGAGMMGSGLVTGAAVLLTGSSLLSGGVLLPVSGVLSVWGFLAMGSYKQQEEKSRELRDAIDPIQSAGQWFDDILYDTHRKVRETKLREYLGRIESDNCAYLSGAKEIFKAIFKVFVEISMDDVKKDMKQVSDVMTQMCRRSSRIADRNI